MQLVLCLFVLLRSAAASYHNVNGGTLQSCSSDGMALTGYTRNGFCVNENDDRGSHHICIDLSSTTGGNFCEVTGQNDWCSSEEMPCHEDPTQQACPIQHWCVCQWAFASYLETAGGCDYIQDIVCEAVNVQAVFAYQQQSQQKYQVALDCLVERCGIDVWKLWLLRGKRRALLLGFAMLCALAALLGYYSHHKRQREAHPCDTREEKLVNYDTNTHEFQ